MAPKKRKSETNVKNIKTKKSRIHFKESNQTNDSLSNGSNKANDGLRRSLRNKTLKSAKTETKVKKCKYFSSETEDNSKDVESDDELDSKPNIVKQSETKSDSDSEEEQDWEEVKDNELPDVEDYNPDIPKEGVQITINDNVVKGKKKAKKCFDINDYIRQRLNRFKRELQLDKHKTSLLLLIARALYLNNSVNDENVRAVAFSITINELKAPKKLTIKFINYFIDWFEKNFQHKYSETKCEQLMINCIHKCLEERVVTNRVESYLTFISLLRSVNQNLNVRLCYALNAVDLKAKDLMLSEKQLETKKKVSNGKKPKVIKDKPKNANKPKNRKIVSSDSEESIQTEENSLEYWTEIFVDNENKWICCDLLNKIIDKPEEIANKVSAKGLSYIIAFDSEGYVRDVTQRYSKDWMSAAMKKRRVDQVWWTQTLQPFERSVRSEAEKAEDMEFEDKLASKPLPTKVSEYKNHPLYVLKKDLLKFQGIYPSDAPPLGYFKDDPVYARECVRILRSRQTWLRFARTVQLGESPYKMVTSRPKWDKYAKVWRRDLPLELFGEWQTEAYVPPEAKDGKVPRNEFGNVELFQPCMLPKGTVHLQLSGLLRIANKLNIDCVPAIVAFDNNNGGIGCHPVTDGFIVCEQFKDILIDAWNEEQENARKRERDKREKRVYANWKTLIKGVLIRERIKKKYHNNNDVEDDEETEEDC